MTAEAISTQLTKHNGEVRRVASVDLLHHDPANARRHSPKNIEAIKGSLLEYGQQKPIVIDKGGKVLAGNGTLEAARAAGLGDLWVVVTDLDSLKQLGFSIADNRTAELAEWDEETLGSLLETLRDNPDANAEAAGFDGAAMSEVIDGIDREAGSDPPDDKYTEQYGVIVVCDDEAHQERVFSALSTKYQCRVVVT
jgi:hypothetical protein